MTEKLRKAWLAQQKAADKVRGLAADATPETRAAAETEFNGAATALQKALDEEPNFLIQNDGEAAELRRLLEGASLGRFYEAAIEHRALDGREAEIQQHFGLNSNQFPVEMLREPEPEARAVTPPPADTGATQRPILMPIFARGDAAFLSVSQPVVPVGDSVHPVLTNRPTVEKKATANSDAVAETTGSFAATVLTPQRLQASFFWRRTEAARFAGMAEALRMALTSGLSEAMDVQVVNQIVADVARTDATGVDDFDSYRSRFVYDLIDGRFANREGDIRMMVGAKTLSDAAKLYRATTADVSVVDSLRRITGGVRVSAHIPAPASNKQDVLVRLGSRPDAVAPIWRQVTLIPDEVTKADKGEIKVTAVALASFKVLRLAGFKRVQAQFQ